MRTGAVAMLLCLAAMAEATAQPAQDTLPRYRLQPVEITILRGAVPDQRAAAAVSSIGRNDIQGAHPTVGLEEALAVVPGVVINNRYNFALGSRIAIRGLGARAAFGVRGVRVLQDGIPLTMPDGQANLNNIDLGAAGRIEVLRGPASSLYGNAAGGVIAIESEPPPATGFAGEARLTTADLGRSALDRLTKLQLKIGGQFSRGDYLVSGSRLESDGYREHSRAEQSNLNARLRINPNGPSTWTFVLNAADAPVAQNPGSLPLDSAQQHPQMAWPRNAQTRSGEAARQIQGGITWRRITDAGTFSLGTYALQRELENPLPFAFIALDRIAGGVRAALDRTLAVGTHEVAFSAGIDAELQRDDRGEFNNNNGQAGATQTRDQRDQVSSFGPFVQARIALTSQLELTTGLRFDAVHFSSDDHHQADGRDDSGERTLSAFSPRIALLWAPRQNFSTYATVSTAFQTPTTTELINAPPQTGVVCCPGGFNQQLEPQRALNLEAGLKGSIADRVRYEFAVFQMAVRDALVPFQVAQVEGRDFFRNSGETRHRGVEFAATAAFTTWATLTGSYAYSRFTFVDDGLPEENFEGNVLPGVPPHHALVRVRVQPHSRIAVELEHEWTAAFHTTDANLDAAKNPAANVLDARAEWDLSVGPTRFQPFVGVNNLLDERYNSSVVINAAGARYFEPAPGRNLYLGARVRFGR